jgi:hypothetical protein
MKPERFEKISRAGASLVIFAAFVFGLTLVAANSFHTSLQHFLS